MDDLVVLAQAGEGVVLVALGRDRQVRQWLPALLQALLPAIIVSLGLTLGLAGGLVSLYQLTSSLIQPLFGYLADRLGRLGVEEALGRLAGVLVDVGAAETA